MYSVDRPVLDMIPEPLPSIHIDQIINQSKNGDLRIYPSPVSHRVGYLKVVLTAYPGSLEGDDDIELSFSWTHSEDLDKVESLALHAISSISEVVVKEWNITWTPDYIRDSDLLEHIRAKHQVGESVSVTSENHDAILIVEWIDYMYTDGGWFAKVHMRAD